MRVTTRMRTALAALALTGSLVASVSGCVTVHGEEALVPAISQEDAEGVLDHYLEVKNEANPGYDAELTATIETGSLGEINGAGQVARARVHPDGNPGYTPLDFSDTRYLIPRQAGWPKYFVADTATNRNETRWLLVFTRGGIDQEWLASYLMLLEPGDVPEFTEDAEGYAEPVAPDDGEGLAMSPAELATAYAAYLQDGAGPFAEGSHTTGERTKRQTADQDLNVAYQRQDLAAEEPPYVPVALRTTEGALVFFSVHHHEKQTWADGQTPVVNEYVEALLEGTATRAVTTKSMAMLGARLPATDATDIPVHSRVPGVITATGE